LISRRTVLVGAASVAALAGAGVAVRTSSKSRTVRNVANVVDGRVVREGAGVLVRRQIGAQPSFVDPFLLLDEFKSTNRDDFIRGFPWHPHRGFETVTIMIDGVVEHGDSVGNSGSITGGGVQWMTAGHGIVHQEMPDFAPSTTSPRLWGYQLWVNLPSTLKMTKPRYQDHAASDVPSLDVDDARVRVLAGAMGSARGPVDGIAVDPLLLDVTLAGGSFRRDIAPDHAVFVQVLDGSLDVGGTRVGDRGLAILGNGDVVDVRGSGRCLLAAARAIGEPVARRGPFVMNTEAELQQAFDDYRQGRLTG
jgi:redox-sensitive bicupin YhaK (pirin superfamily)